MLLDIRLTGYDARINFASTSFISAIQKNSYVCLHTCEQLAQGCYAALPRVGFEPTATGHDLLSVDRKSKALHIAPMLSVAFGN